MSGYRFWRDTDGREHMDWHGSKIPRGAPVGGGYETVEWAQHGRLLDKDGKELGTYIRVVEFGGANRNLHEMIVTARPITTMEKRAAAPEALARIAGVMLKVELEELDAHTRRRWPSMTAAEQMKTDRPRFEREGMRPIEGEA